MSVSLTKVAVVLLGAMPATSVPCDVVVLSMSGEGENMKLDPDDPEGFQNLQNQLVEKFELLRPDEMQLVLDGEKLTADGAETVIMARCKEEGRLEVQVVLSGWSEDVVRQILAHGLYRSRDVQIVAAFVEEAPAADFRYWNGALDLFSWATERDFEGAREILASLGSQQPAWLTNALENAVSLRLRVDLLQKFVEQSKVDNNFQQVLRSSEMSLLSQAIMEHRMDTKEEVRGEMVQALIDGGVDLRDRFGVDASTPLIEAVSWKKPDIVRRILETDAGLATVNDADRAGNTALMCAVERSGWFESGELEYVIDLLCKAGADVNQINERTRESALEILVKRRGDAAVAQQLLDAGAVVTDQVLDTAEEVRKELAREAREFRVPRDEIREEVRRQNVEKVKAVADLLDRAH